MKSLNEIVHQMEENNQKSTFEKIPNTDKIVDGLTDYLGKLNYEDDDFCFVFKVVHGGQYGQCEEYKGNATVEFFKKEHYQNENLKQEYFNFTINWFLSFTEQDLLSEIKILDYQSMIRPVGKDYANINVYLKNKMAEYFWRSFEKNNRIHPDAQIIIQRKEENDDFLNVFADMFLSEFYQIKGKSNETRLYLTKSELKVSNEQKILHQQKIIKDVLCNHKDLFISYGSNYIEKMKNSEHLNFFSISVYYQLLKIEIFYDSDEGGRQIKSEFDDDLAIIDEKALFNSQIF